MLDKETLDGKRPGQRWSTERKVVTGFSFALACLAVVGAMSYLSVLRLQANEAAVSHTREVLSSLESCLSTMTDAETAERGHVITGDARYLRPYHSALSQIGGLQQHLRELTRDNPEREDRLRRRVIDTMQGTERDLLRQRELHARRSTVVSRVVIVSGGLGAFAIVGLAVTAIRRGFAGRRRAEMALQRANEQLEARVQERTADLARANSSLSVSERRFRALIERSSDCITLLDATSKVVFLSPAIMDVAGYTPEERLGQSGMQHIHPDDAPRLREIMRQLFASPGAALPLEWRGRHKNGQWIWVEGVATNLLQDPAVQAIVVNYRNVTERKQSEAKFQAQLARLALLGDITRAIGERQDVSSIFEIVIRTLEEHLPVDFCCVFRSEPGDKFITVSHVGAHSLELAKALTLTEQTRVEIDGNGLSRCVRGVLVCEPDLNEIAFPFPQRLARGGLRSLVAAPLRIESQVFGVLLAARRQVGSFSSGECEFLRQVSEHVALAAHQAQLYSALQRAYDDLRQTQQAVMQQERLLALGKMASGIAHDINNAVSPVTLYAESLLESEPDLSPRARNHLKTILLAIEDVAHTLTRMREFYRLPEPAAAMRPVDLNQLVLQVVDLTRAGWSDMAQKRGMVIEVRTVLTPDLPPVLGIASEIREALTNLILNAIDAMPKGGTLTLRTGSKHPKLEGSPVVRDAGPATAVQVEISDTGLGMDEDTRRRCLEPFFTTKGERGTGLGLAMVYGTMQRHGGDLEIDSNVGTGTTLRLSFAVADTSVGGQGSTAAVPVIPRLRMLIVDDDPLVLNSLRETLEQDGHVVTAAAGGQAGIDAFLDAKARSNPFTVVITDLGMPYVDGQKVSAAVKAEAPDTTVLLLTGWGQRLVAEGDIPPHVDRVLSKPPKLREIRAALLECAVAK